MATEQVIMTRDIIKGLPDLYAGEGNPDPQVVFKLFTFTPWGSWTWFITEGRHEGPGPNDWLLFGFAYDASYPDGAELGYVSLAELMEVRGPGGLRIERDAYFKARPLSECKRTLGLGESRMMTDEELYPAGDAPRTVREWNPDKPEEPKADTQGADPVEMFVRDLLRDYYANLENPTKEPTN